MCTGSSADLDRDPESPNTNYCCEACEKTQSGTPVPVAPFASGSPFSTTGGGGGGGGGGLFGGGSGGGGGGGGGLFGGSGGVGGGGGGLFGGGGGARTPSRLGDDPSFPFGPAIEAVLKQVHPQSSMSSSAVKLVHECLDSAARRITQSISRGQQAHGIGATSSTCVVEVDAQSAVAELLQPPPGELKSDLLNHARSEGVKATSKFTSGDKSGGLQFPLDGMSNLLAAQGLSPMRDGLYEEGARLYLAAVFEYLTAEVVELSGGAAKGVGPGNAPLFGGSSASATVIEAEHVVQAIQGDKELCCLFPMPAGAPTIGGSAASAGAPLFGGIPVTAAAPSFVASAVGTVPASTASAGTCGGFSLGGGSGGGLTFGGGTASSSGGVGLFSTLPSGYFAPSPAPTPAPTPNPWGSPGGGLFGAAPATSEGCCSGCGVTLSDDPLELRCDVAATSRHLRAISAPSPSPESGTRSHTGLVDSHASSALGCASRASPSVRPRGRPPPTCHPSSKVPAAHVLGGRSDDEVAHAIDVRWYVSAAASASPF